MDLPQERRLPPSRAEPAEVSSAADLGADVAEMIRVARQQVANVVNAGLTLLHWQIGNRIRLEVLREERAEYGAMIVEDRSRKLRAEFGRGFSRRNLFNMVRFAEVFPVRSSRVWCDWSWQIVQSLIA